MTSGRVKNRVLGVVLIAAAAAVGWALFNQLQGRMGSKRSGEGARPVPVEVDVTQAGLDQGPGSRDFRVVSESIKGEQDGLDRRRWTVPVPAGGTVDLNVVYEARY